MFNLKTIGYLTTNELFAFDLQAAFMIPRHGKSVDKFSVDLVVVLECRATRVRSIC